MDGRAIEHESVSPWNLNSINGRTLTETIRNVRCKKKENREAKYFTIDYVVTFTFFFRFKKRTRVLMYIRQK